MAQTARASASVQGPCDLRLLTWNIDGLDNVHDIAMRAGAVCDVIEKEKPGIVLLQEVVSENIGVLTERLMSTYSILAPSMETSRYFTAILTRYDVCDTSASSHKVVTFPMSTMSRDLIIMSGVVLSKTQHRIAVCTAHLESLGRESAERKRQLAMTYSEMTELRDTHDAVLYGGDTNLRAAEVRSCRAPAGIENAWEKCGSPQDARYTFDIKSNDNNLRKGWDGPPIQTQYDKVFWAGGRRSSSKEGTLVPKVFRLIGKEKLPAGCYASDHFGIVCDLC